VTGGDQRVLPKCERTCNGAAQVNVLDFKERKKGKDYVLCELVVEKETQKGIVIGARGSALKALATAARADMEEYLERGVFLEVMVRVDKDWRKNAKKLEKFGY
jgi:GTPase